MVCQLFQNVQFQNPPQWSPCNLVQNDPYRTCNEGGGKDEVLVTHGYK